MLVRVGTRSSQAIAVRDVSEHTPNSSQLLPCMHVYRTANRLAASGLIPDVAGSWLARYMTPRDLPKRLIGPMTASVSTASISTTTSATDSRAISAPGELNRVVLAPVQAALDGRREQLAPAPTDTVSA